MITEEIAFYTAQRFSQPLEIFSKLQDAKESKATYLYAYDKDARRIGCCYLDVDNEWKFTARVQNEMKVNKVPA